MSVKIFLTGATGYIGGAVLHELLKPERKGKYTISALVRGKEQGETLKGLGVIPVFGSLDDLSLITESAKNADVVIDTASADHFPSAQAITKGLLEKNDSNAILIHTSGTSVIAYDDKTDVPFDDLDIDRIHNIPDRALHRNVDKYLFDAAEGHFKLVIITPSTINGLGNGPFKKTSIQAITMAKVAVKRRKPGYFGPRKDIIWTNVHIQDLADLYILVLEGLLSGKSQDWGKKGGWYFGATTEHTWEKLAEKIGEILLAKKLVDTAEVSLIEKEITDPLGDLAIHAFGSDSRAIGNRGKKLGWNPHHPNVYDSLESEINFIIQNNEISGYDALVESFRQYIPK